MCPWHEHTPEEHAARLAARRLLETALVPEVGTVAWHERSVERQERAVERLARLRLDNERDSVSD